MHPSFLTTLWIRRPGRPLTTAVCSEPHAFTAFTDKACRRQPHLHWRSSHSGQIDARNICRFKLAAPRGCCVFEMSERCILLYGTSGTALSCPLPILGEAGKLSDVRLDGYLLVNSRGGQTYHIRVTQDVPLSPRRVGCVLGTPIGMPLMWISQAERGIS